MDWNKVYSILVEQCGAHEHLREQFVSLNGDFTEYRFGGVLGLGSKIWNHSGEVYITCYPEDRSLDNDLLISRVNRKLAKLKEDRNET